MGSVTRRRGWFAAGAMVAMVALAAWASPQGLESGLRKPPSEGRLPRQADMAPEGMGWRGPGARRELGERELDRVIATAGDIDPAWGEALESLRKSDPAALRQRLGSQARRLVVLSWLRERQPELYETRVEDFRVQRQVRDAVERVRKARQAVDAEEEALALAEARLAVERQVDLDIKARAHELVAMDRALKEARQRLQDDIASRSRRVQQLVEQVQAGEMPRFGRGGPADTDEGPAQPPRRGGRGREGGSPVGEGP